MHHYPFSIAHFRYFNRLGLVSSFFPPPESIAFLTPKNEYCVSYARRDTRFFYFRFFKTSFGCIPIGAGARSAVTVREAMFWDAKSCVEVGTKSSVCSGEEVPGPGFVSFGSEVTADGWVRGVARARGWIIPTLSRPPFP
jgi:hypothetical protein